MQTKRVECRLCRLVHIQVCLNSSLSVNLTLCFRYLNAGPAAIGGFYIRSGLDDGGRRYVQIYLTLVLLSNTP